jgi:hypothetical protein
MLVHDSAADLQCARRKRSSLFVSRVLRSGWFAKIKMLFTCVVTGLT